MFYILGKTGRIERSATSVPNENSLKKVGYVLVKSELNLPIANIEVQGFPGKPVLVEKQPISSQTIVLSTRAKDSDSDGVPDLPADGKSHTDILVSLHDADGATLKECIEITLRVSAGRISRRKVITKNGKARVTITASYDTVTAFVHASAEGFLTGNLTLEFVPAEPQNT